jgi:hypothetical protein
MMFNKLLRSEEASLGFFGGWSAVLRVVTLRKVKGGGSSG